MPICFTARQLARHTDEVKFKALLFLAFLSLSGCTTESSGPSASHDVTASVLFLGDTHFGESYEVDLDDRYSMDEFSVFLASADLTVANLETPLTTLEESPYEGEKDYVHWSDPVFAMEAFSNYGFDAFSLGNNHSMDYGWPGLEETLSSLEVGGFSTFGAGDSEASAVLPYEGELFDLAVFGGYDEVSSYEKMGFYAGDDTGGVYAITQAQTLDAIRDYRSSHPEALIVAFPHWGKNYAMKDSSEEAWAHSFVDAGADIVIGHGAHLFQEVEEYEGKWIVYGLGNFVFNAPGRYQKLDVEPYSAVARLVEMEGAMSLRLYPIFSDNLITDYQPRFVTEDEFEGLTEREDLESLQSAVDEFGFYFELPMK